MNKWIIGVGALILAVVGFFVFGVGGKEKTPMEAGDYKSVEFVIEGQSVKLENGVAEVPSATGSTGSPQEGSASKTVTKYFGNDLKTDLNGDGKEDVAYLVTQSGGGSGTFFYVVAAIATDRGYVGSDAYFLGDRIAPQNINLSQNPRHKNVIVVNYANRAVGEPMTAQPSVGKSVYLKLDPASVRWGIVESDPESL